METLVMHPETKEQLSALKAIAKALKIPFERNKNDTLNEREKTIELYGIELVNDIERAEKSIKKGNVKTIDPSKNIWENIK